MLYIFNQYRVLSATIKRGYEITQNGNRPPLMDHIHVKLLPKFRKIHHISILVKLGYIDLSCDNNDTQHGWRLNVTEDGLKYYQLRSIANANAYAVAVWNIFLLGIGIVIGKIF